MAYGYYNQQPPTFLEGLLGGLGQGILKRQEEKKAQRDTEAMANMFGWTPDVKTAPYTETTLPPSLKNYGQGPQLQMNPQQPVQPNFNLSETTGIKQPEQQPPADFKLQNQPILDPNAQTRTITPTRADVQKQFNTEFGNQLKALARQMSPDAFRDAMPQLLQLRQERFAQINADFDKQEMDDAYTAFENETDIKKKIGIGLKKGIIGKEGAMMLIQPETEHKIFETGGKNVVVMRNKFTDKYYDGNGQEISPEQLQAMIQPTLTPAQQTQFSLQQGDQRNKQYGGTYAYDVNGLGAFKKALFGQESGGNYNARNPYSGAFGIGQIMPENWSSWAAEAGLPQGAQQTPENQERVIDNKLSQYFNKYRDWNLVAMAWYAGPGYVDSLLSGNPMYSPDAPQAEGHPSVNSYVKSVMSGFGNVVGVESKDGGKLIPIPGLGTMTTKEALALKGQYSPKQVQTIDAYGNPKVTTDPGNPDIVALIDAAIGPVVAQARGNMPVDQNAVINETFNYIDQQLKGGAATRQQIEADVRSSQKLKNAGIDPEIVIQGIVWPDRMKLQTGTNSPSSYSDLQYYIAGGT